MAKFIVVSRFGKEIAKIEYEEFDFSGIKDSPATKFLIKYCDATDTTPATIIIDERAPQQYKELAILHEAICQGKQHKDLIAGLDEVPDDSIHRCSHIEMGLFRANLFDNSRDELIELAAQRKAMFEFLLDNHLNPKFNDSFERSISAIEQIQRELLLADDDTRQ